MATIHVLVNGIGVDLPDNVKIWKFKDELIEALNMPVTSNN